MYICVCNAVTERDIHQAAEAGARRLRDLREPLGVTVDCGRCACAAKCCLDQAVTKAKTAARSLMPNPTRLLEATA